MAIIPRWQTPISRWQLDGNANDLYGLHNGTPTNITYSTDAKEKGLSGSFNGSSSVINCGNWSFFSYTNFSISLWIKVTGTNDALLTCTRPGYNIPRVQFILDSAGYLNYTVVNNSGTLFSQGGPPCNDGVWHHIVIVDANGTVTSYLDGSSTTIAGSYSRSNLSNLTTVNMGIMVIATNERPFAGLMDDVRFYDVALTADEVMNLYKSYATPIWQQPLHHWKLDGDAIDSAGNRNGTTTDITYNSASKISGNYSGSFNGSSSNINVGDWSWASYTNFSVSAWFKVSGVSDAILTCTRPGYKFPRLQFMLGSAGIVGYAVVNDSDSVLLDTGAPKAYNDGKWHHTILIDANGTVTCYIDGFLSFSASYTRSNLSNLSRVTMGAMITGTTDRPLAGLLDDVRFYDVALSAADVRALYNSYFTEKASNFMSIL